MNRRGFFGAIGAAVAGFSILPAATTYTRLWKAVKPTRLFAMDTAFGSDASVFVVSNPNYVNAPFEIGLIDMRGSIVLDKLPLRFDSCPPWDVWTDPTRFFHWQCEHTVPPFIYERT